MGTCGWLGTNEILDFSFHRLTKVVEKDLGEYAGKSTVRTWVQRLGQLGGKTAAERPNPQAQNRLCNIQKVCPCRQWTCMAAGAPHLLFSAEKPEAQRGREVTGSHNNLVLPDEQRPKAEPDGNNVWGTSHYQVLMSTRSEVLSLVEQISGHNSKSTSAAFIQIFIQASALFLPAGVLRGGCKSIYTLTAVPYSCWRLAFQFLTSLNVQLQPKCKVTLNMFYNYPSKDEVEEEIKIHFLNAKGEAEASVGAIYTCCQ